MASPPEEADAEARLLFLAQSDPEQFAPLYQRYFPRVYAYCLRRASDAQEAEDLCSQVFIRALRGLHTYRGGQVAAWLFQIAHNVVVNHYRDRRATLPLDDLDFADEFDFEAVERAEAGQLVHQLLADLPEDQRDLLALMLDAGLTSGEIGAALGKSAVSVRVQVHRIIKGLRRRYHQMTGGDE
jgi:RNA polymerase sigma-70 factor (ECF subfamily)